jgi:hypothetical protein
MCSPSMSIEGIRPARARPPGRRLVLGMLVALGGLSGCGREPPPAPVAQSRPAGPRPIRVIVPRETPRSPFFLGLKAQALDDEACEIKLEVSSRIGGPTTVEFSLPEGAVIAEGDRIQEATLEVGEAREFRIVVKVPRAGHDYVAAYATVEGRRGEAFVEFGDPPTAEERGFEVRTRNLGQRIIRINSDEKPK